MLDKLEEILKNKDNPQILTYSVIVDESLGTVSVLVGGGLKRSKHFKKRKLDDLKLLADVIKQIEIIKEHEKWMKRSGTL